MHALTPTLPSKGLTTLDALIVDLEFELESEMHPNYTSHEPNTYTIWYIKYDSVCDPIGCFDAEISREMFSIHVT